MLDYRLGAPQDFSSLHRLGGGKQMPGLEELIDRSIGGSPALDLAKAGPASNRLVSYLGEEARANAFIASNFWKALISSNYFPHHNYFGLNPQLFSASEKIMVFSSDRNRFDLVIYSPVPLGAEGFQVQTDANEIADGWISWSRQIPGRLDPVLWNPQLAVEALSWGKFGMVLLARPPMKPASVPDPPAQVQCPAGNSTAGAVAQRRGKDGVTGALHALRDPNTGVIHTSVTVGGATGTVAATDTVSDSCFIEVDPTPRIGTAAAKVMRNILPRGKQAATFGRGSSRTVENTTISGWAVELPQVNLYRQDKIYTTNVLSSGDSGSALVTSDGFIVGFAYEEATTTNTTDPSSWIWAHSVVEALDLTIT